MGGLEGNKIFAALLVAGITASLSGFVAHKAYHSSHGVEEFSYHIEGGEASAEGSVKKEKLPEPVLELISQADVARGEKLSKACMACHNFTDGGPNGTGPNLYNIVNRKIGSVNGFSYSKAMSEKSSENWTYSSLNQFLWKPKWYVSGTKMNYIGMKKPEDRAAMIAWLRSLSGSPAPLPSIDEIESEKQALLGEELIEETANEAVEKVIKESDH